MKLMIPISALAFLLCLSQIVRADTVQVETLPYDYGSLNGFYSIGYHISMGLVPTLKNETLQKVADLVTDNGGSVSDVASDILKAYVGPIVFMVFGGLLALAAGLSCLIICCGRCFCKCCGVTDYQPAHEKRTLLYVAGFILFVSFPFVLTGAIIYGKAVDDTYDTLSQDAYEDIQRIIFDLEGLVTNTTAEIIDSVGKNVQTTFDETADEINAAPHEMIINFETTTGLSVFSSETKNRDEAVGAVQDDITLCKGELQNILGIQAGTEVQDQLTTVGLLQTALDGLNIAMQAFDKGMAVVNINVTNIERDLNTSLGKSSGKIKEAKDSVTATTDDITTAINDMHTSLQKVENTTQQWIDDVKDWSGLKAFRSGMQALGLFPLSIALVFLIIGIVASGGRIARSQTKPHQRSTRSHISGGLSVAGIYIGFMVSAFIMVMSVIFFFGGFAVSSVCKPLFRDDAYALYRASDKFDIEVDPYEDKSGDNPIATNIGNIFRECSSRTMFSLIGGENIISVNDVMDTIKFAELQTEANEKIPEKIWPTNGRPDLTAVGSAIGEWNKKVGPFQDANADDFLKQTLVKNQNDQNVKQAHNDLVKLQTSVKTLSAVLAQYNDGVNTLQKYFANDKLTHDALSQQVNDTFKEVTDTTQVGLQAFIDDLMNNVAPCGPFLILYDNVGVLVCDHIGRPVHGMWAALGLAALALLPASFSLLLLVRWLLRMDSHYYRDEIEDTGPMIWAGSAVPPEVQTIPATMSSYSYPRNQSLGRLDLKPIDEQPFPADYADSRPASQQLHRPDSLYPEVGLPRANKGFEEYSGDGRRTDNWDIPLPEDSPPSTTQRLRRF
ncbi:unnamed protein product, partial [Mesorhabditis belari]|uniref:Prominin-1-A n=1 Tax=Mesorhabditis belari TaxID=2138241 RepID=A0AAF3F754_9BILA